jgi:hypothetical protein
MVAHICNPSTREAEAGGSQAQSELQARLHSETLFQNNDNYPPLCKKTKTQLYTNLLGLGV